MAAGDLRQLIAILEHIEKAAGVKEGKTEEAVRQGDEFELLSSDIHVALDSLETGFLSLCLFSFRHCFSHFLFLLGLLLFKKIEEWFVSFLFCRFRSEHSFLHSVFTLCWPQAPVGWRVRAEHEYFSNPAQSVHQQNQRRCQRTAEAARLGLGKVGKEREAHAWTTEAASGQCGVSCAWMGTNWHETSQVRLLWLLFPSLLTHFVSLLFC